MLLLALLPVLGFLRLRVRRRRLRRPKRIILVRHGESQGNVDTTLYSEKPDSQIPLTARGFEQGTAAGKRIRKLIGNENARFFFSPYLRTRQTLMAILKAFEGRPVEVTSEPRLREQDFGNFQNPQQMEQVYTERQKFGRFYFRFPSGEAGTDVYDRVCDFWSTLYRFMDAPARGETQRTVENFILVTHGLLIRIFCMCYFRWTVQEFEKVWNPSNCDVWVLEKTPDSRYRLAGCWDGSSFEPIKFGVNKTETVHEHMKEPLSSRLIVPGETDPWEDIRLTHLRVPDS